MPIVDDDAKLRHVCRQMVRPAGFVQKSHRSRDLRAKLDAAIPAAG